MEDEVLKRSMFSKPMTKAARNSGIMAGFEDEDMMEDMQPEEPEEQMSPMARTPQNPEILMNTLRGDMRSVDARVQELAQMVGEQAAMETPPEVLALLQAQLAQQQAPAQGGIGALPQSPGMPPQGMMPPEMAGMPPQGAGPQAPVGAPPFPQGASAPQQFSHGGAVEPATPDGLPPAHYVLAGMVNPLSRLATMGADKAAMLGQEANIIGGRLMSQGFPQQFPAVFENLRGPGGRFIAEQSLKYPTLTQHLSNVAENSPWLARTAGAIAASPVVMGMRELTGTMPTEMSPEEKQRRADAVAQIPGRIVNPSPEEQLAYDAIDAARPPSPDKTLEKKPEMPAPPVVSTEAAPAAKEDTASFIAGKLGTTAPKVDDTADTMEKTKALYKI